MIVAKYKFNPSTYANLLPVFNSEFTSYTKSDVTNSDGTITRTIESTSLPTLMRFGETSTSNNRSNSLLEILSMNTSNLTTMANMFGRCTNLTSIMCNWDTSKVTSMGSMFISCSKLVSLDVSNFDTSLVTTMDIMFASCSSLTQLNVSKWNTSKVTNMNTMFQYCSSLTSLDLSNWNTSQVTNMFNMFNGCGGLVSLDISNFNTSKVTNMSAMFGRCSSLTSLNISNWDTSKVTNMRSMFNGCSSLTSLNINNWNTSQVTNMDSMFKGCSKLISLDLNNWNTSNVTDMDSMFRDCSSLVTLNINNWNTSQVTNISNMFSSCTNLTSLDLSNWNTSKITTAYLVFYKCSSLTSLNVSNWDTSKITNMESIFGDCSSLTSLDLSNWNISNVTNSYGIFEGCSLLRKVNLKYANQSTVSKIHELLPDRSSTTEGYILSSVDLTSDKNWETLKFTHNELYLPQPLRKIGDVKDRLYWDYDKGHYCIEENIIKAVLNGSEGWSKQGSLCTDVCYMAYLAILDSSSYTELTYLNDSFPKLGSQYSEKIDKEGIYSNWGGLYVNIFNTRLPSIDIVGFKQWLSENPITIYYVLPQPNIIDLTEMNQKFSFDTYLPNTYVDVTNLPLQPYKLQLEDDTVRYKSTIEPSTLYTIQFNCLSKLTTKLTLDLGGTRKTVDPIIGVNHVQITTPSVLASDRLFLIGTGIVIKEVIVNKGNMNQYTKYFDGEQSVGELQDDGSYIIRISTDNYTSLWEGDL